MSRQVANEYTEFREQWQANNDRTHEMNGYDYNHPERLRHLIKYCDDHAEFLSQYKGGEYATVTLAGDCVRNCREMVIWLEDRRKDYQQRLDEVTQKKGATP